MNAKRVSISLLNLFSQYSQTLSVPKIPKYQRSSCLVPQLQVLTAGVLSGSQKPRSGRSMPMINTI